MYPLVVDMMFTMFVIVCLVCFASSLSLPLSLSLCLAGMTRPGLHCFHVFTIFHRLSILVYNVLPRYAYKKCKSYTYMHTMFSFIACPTCSVCFSHITYDFV